MTTELKGEVLSRIVISDKQLQYIQRKLTYTQFNKLICKKNQNLLLFSVIYR